MFMQANGNKALSSCYWSSQKKWQSKTEYKFAKRMYFKNDDWIFKKKLWEVLKNILRAIM